MNEDLLSTINIGNAPLVASLRLGRRKSSVGLIEAAALGAITGGSLSNSISRKKSEAGAAVPAADVIVELPDMKSLHYIGLYCHSFAMGLVGGAIITAATMCTYVYHGPDNLCANSW